MRQSTDGVPENAANRNAGTSPLSEQLQAIADALGQIRYGVIQLTVHDGRLMQLDITERRRFA
ncbi:MAG: hypothetical protein CL820_04260 [Croceicoccus sp.]|nr:hypothetical protein [Croceicoccus sp.]MAL25102.1 hypothetical protein [Croceicoccus sp.]